MKNSFNFSLKSIGYGLYTNGVIDDKWTCDDDGVNGLTSIYYLWNNEEQESVVKYNEMDCKMLHYIKELKM